ncbi:MAG: hypothetical protein AAB288_05690, partial [Acidobacteriota bacterium]
ERFGGKMDRKKRELICEVVRLQEVEYKTFRQIGELLGISRSWACELYRRWTPAMDIEPTDQPKNYSDNADDEWDDDQDREDHEADDENDDRSDWEYDPDDEMGDGDIIETTARVCDP